VLVQSLYLVVDIYFVTQLGPSVAAGVSSAGTVLYITTALGQMISVGTIARVSQAIGQRDRVEANCTFNQALLLSAIVASATMFFGYSLSDDYMSALAGDAVAQASGEVYLAWMFPGLFAGFLQVTMAAGLRSVGITQPVMFIQVSTVALNIVLAPILVLGWLSGSPYGVAGAGLASTIAAVAGLAATTAYVLVAKQPMHFLSFMCWPRLRYWKQILAVGGPAGAELILSFIYMTIMFWVVGPYGADAQAALGIGSRLLQSLMFVPVIAIGFAAAPIVGQNIGAGLLARARETFGRATALCIGCMTVSIAVTQWRPDTLMRLFTPESGVVTIGTEFLRWMSLALLPQAVIFACSSVFQGMGNTRPALISSASRLFLFVPLAMIFTSVQPATLEWFWIAALGTAFFQAGVSFYLLSREFRGHATHAMARLPVS
jgi:putative MATE family efflux protein